MREQLPAGNDFGQHPGLAAERVVHAARPLGRGLRRGYLLTEPQSLVLNPVLTDVRTIGPCRALCRGSRDSTCPTTWPGARSTRRPTSGSRSTSALRPSYANELQ